MSPKSSNLPNSPLYQSRYREPAAPEEPPIRTNPIFRRRRNLVFACAVAVITIAGTLIGAGLKTKRQAAVKTITEQTQIEAANTAKQLSLLESTRGQLWQQKVGLEKKIEDLRARREKRKTIEQQKRAMTEANDGTVSIKR